MDAECLQYLLTEEERTQFERDGFIVVDNALPASMVEGLIKAVDRLGPGDDFLGKDDLLLELIDWHRTFPKCGAFSVGTSTRTTRRSLSRLRRMRNKNEQNAGGDGIRTVTA